jgi:hypothetical protein
MAEKPITLMLDENTPVEFQLGASISREQLYGESKRSVEQEGTPLEKVIVTPWGELLPDKCTKGETVDNEGSLTGKTVECDETGEVMPVHITSFKEARKLTEAKWHEVACLKASKLMPVKVSGDLGEGIWKTQFCYRDSCTLEDGFLIIREDGAFLLTGAIKEVPFAGLEETYQFFEEEDETEEEDEDSFDSL